jgi:hypothetical protein
VTAAETAPKKAVEREAGIVMAQARGMAVATERIKRI